MFSLPVLLSLLAAFAAPILAAPAHEEPETQFSPAYRYDKHETNYRKLPKRSQLPRVPGHLEGSAWLWGDDDGVSFVLEERRKRDTLQGAGLIKGGMIARTSQLPHAAEGVPEHEGSQDWRHGPAEVSLYTCLPATTLSCADREKSLPVKLVNPPLFNRPAFNHTFMKFGDGTAAVLDEQYQMNTQTSTQWDGFHHFAHLESGIFYNGCTEV